MARGGTVERLLPPDAIVTDPDTLRWGVVSTIKAPTRAIARFAAWHLEAGASRITIYLDKPDRQAAEFLTAHPRVDVVQCGPEYWDRKPIKARKTHQLRQTFNASRSYRKARDLHWLAHLDVDEFLLSDRPMADLLAAAPDDCAFVRLSPVEMLHGADDGTVFFKRTPKAAGAANSVLSRLFPTFGAHLPQGFISYSGGKNIVRTGLGRLRLGIHGTKENGAKIVNGAAVDAVIGHAHAPDFETFERHMAFRMAKGSYRDLPNGNSALHGILQLLKAEGGTDGLRRFYDEVCTARPDLITALRGLGMLVERRMDLDGLAKRHFGAIPAERSP